ncbi:MAG: hypothetical protein HY958_02225 [Bacteroidia bacterium]|nr:hypothetical protein [Bacteroidia bacterium]
MSNLSCILICFLIFINHAQPQQKEKNLNNKITKDYISVPGTKISMFSPKGFTLATDFKGFRNVATGSSIMITIIPGNINNNLPGFTKDMLQNSGVFMLGSEEFKINGFRAVLIKAKQIAYQNSYLKWMLITGNDKETYLVNGSFLEKMEKEESKTVLASVLSTVYQPDKKVNPTEGMAFELSVKNTKFKQAKLVTNSLIYTVDGLVPTKSKDLSIITASAMTLSAKVNDQKKYCINSIKQYPSISEIPDKNIMSLIIDNCMGYEIFAYGVNKKNAKTELIYQAVLFNGDMSYSMVGIAVDAFEENLKIFKQIMQTFKKK